MRQSRLKVSSSQGDAVYHCVSRVVDRQFLFGPEEKERFVALLRRHARFCQVEVLTYCVMSNHFHLLVSVPQRPEAMPGDEELLAHLEACGVSALRLADLRQKLAHYAQIGAVKAAEAVRQSYWNRCWDLSFFMKGLKQEFTQWYNRKHHRKTSLTRPMNNVAQNQMTKG